MNKGFSSILIGIVLAIAFIGAGIGGYFVFLRKYNNSPIACTQEAKQCPDGSYVGRTGPNCEFAPCPSEALCEGGSCANVSTSATSAETINSLGGSSSIDTSTWKTYRNEKYGFEAEWPWGISEGNSEILFLNEYGLPYIRTIKSDKEFQTYCDEKGCKERFVKAKNLSVHIKFTDDAIEVAEAKIKGGSYILFFSMHISPDDTKFFESFVSNIQIIDGSVYDISTWKTYRNEKYGFEVRYPADWLIWNPAQGYRNPTDGTERLIALAPKYSSTPAYGEVGVVIYKKGESIFSIDLAKGLFYPGGLQDKPWHISAHVPVYISGKLATKFRATEDLGCENEILSLAEGDYEYWFFGYCGDNGVPFEEFDQILSTFKFVEPGGVGLWDPICSKEKLGDFTVTVELGDTLTSIARKHVQAYLNTLTLKYFPNIAPTLSSEEKIYAEDYIVMQFGSRFIYPGEVITTPCALIEEASRRARLLTVAQKQNLEQYSKNVTDFETLELIKRIIEESKKPGSIQPILIPIQ